VVKVSSKIYSSLITEDLDMERNLRHWYLLLAPALGVVVMLGGLATLLFRHDDASGYSLLGVGAVIFGMSEVGNRRGHC
jgi:hypothetical protein